MPANPLAVQAGSLRHAVSVQALSIIPDSFGEPKQIWSTVLQARAAIETASSREIYEVGQFTGQVTHTITMRWPGSAAVKIVPGMQVTCDGHVYKIQTVDNMRGLNRLLKIMALSLDDSQ